MRLDPLMMDSLKKLFAARGMKREFEAQSALFVWPNVMGGSVVKLSRPLFVQNDVLFVQVGSHVVAQEYNMMRERFLEQLNAHLERSLKDIRFRVATLDSAEPPVAPQPDLETVALSDSDMTSISEALGDMEDEALKASLRSMMEAAYRAQQCRAQRPGYRTCESCGLHHQGPEPVCSFCRIERESKAAG